MQRQTPPPASATWTIDELAAKANSALDTPKSLDGSADSRFAAKLTARNIRSLQSQGAISKPVKVGREAFYGAEHFQELLDARKMMASGISAKGVQSLRAASSSVATSAALDASMPALQESILAAPASASTADALKFLSGLSAPMAGSPKLERQESMLFGGSASSATPSGSHEPTPFGGEHGKPSLMSSGYQSMRGLARALGSGPPPCQAIHRLEIEPFQGMRISAAPPTGSSPTLTAEQRALALAAVEQAWAAAVAKQNSDISK